jgi:23S rRNA pseudouridine2605 synthase
MADHDHPTDDNQAAPLPAADAASTNAVEGTREGQRDGARRRGRRGRQGGHHEVRQEERQAQRAARSQAVDAVYTSVTDDQLDAALEATPDELALLEQQLAAQEALVEEALRADDREASDDGAPALGDDPGHGLGAVPGDDDDTAMDAETASASALCEAPSHPGKRVLAPERDAPKLQKVLAQAGVGSRRDIEAWMAAGRVLVNNQAAHTGQRVARGDRISVDGKPVHWRLTPPPARVLAYHKPVGEIVSHDDPEQRPTVFRKMPRLAHGKWQSVGRLDINTEGLLLLTNHGELAYQLMHPRFGVEREYAVRVLGTLGEEARSQLLTGVDIEGYRAAFKSIDEGRGEGANRWYRVVIAEGRHREVRKLFDTVGLTVSRLIRIRYGMVVLPAGLKRGVWVDLPEADVLALRRMVGDVDRSGHGPREGREGREGAKGRGPRGHNGPGRGPRDASRDGHRDASRDGHRDAPRDAPRDGPRDAAADSNFNRGAGRDGYRDDPRGPRRDKQGRRRDGQGGQGPRQAPSQPHNSNGPGTDGNGPPRGSARLEFQPPQGFDPTMTSLDGRGRGAKGPRSRQGPRTGRNIVGGEVGETGDLVGVIPNPLQQTYDQRALKESNRMPQRDYGEESPIPNPLQQTFDQRALKEANRVPKRDYGDDDPIPNPLQQTFDRRQLSAGNPDALNLGRRGGSRAAGAARNGGQPDPMQTAVGYIGGDAMRNKQRAQRGPGAGRGGPRGPGGGGGNRGGPVGGAGGGGGGGGRGKKRGPR